MYDDRIFNSLVGGMLIFAIIVLLLLVAATVIYIVGLWKLFKKAGKNGWEALIPLYNTYILIEIAGLNWWYFLISISGTICALLRIKGLTTITSCASLLVNFFCFYNIAKKMKQNPTGFAVGGALLPMVFVPIMGLSNKYTFDTSIKVSPNGPIGNNNTSNEPERYCLGCGKKLQKDEKFCANCGKEVI